MGVNFRNPAGTDLDSLFYISNNNAGGIGFRASNGQDLGNRYTNASKLNYSVGYRNSAGTDLGYLRGKTCPPKFGKWWVTPHPTRLWEKDSEGVGYTDVYGYCSVGADLIGPGSMTFQIQGTLVAKGNAKCVSGYGQRFKDNSTSVEEAKKLQVERDTGKMFPLLVRVNPNAELCRDNIFSGRCDLHPRRNFIFRLFHWEEGFGMRIYLRACSQYGNTEWVHKDFWY